MPKANKTISLDTEIIEELEKEKNYSGLINDLLKDYYNSTGYLKREELLQKKKLAEIEKKRQEELIRKIDKELESLKAREAKEKEIFKNIPDEILQDFRAFKAMSKDIFRIRFREIYSPKYLNLKFEEALKAYDYFYNK